MYENGVKSQMISFSRFSLPAFIIWKKNKMKIPNTNPKMKLS